MNIPQADFLGVVILTNALVEVIKKVDRKSVLYPYLSIIALVIGWGLGMAIGVGWFGSFFVGLSAIGLYDGITHTSRSIK